jgi:SAM-dependent methyltransferase
MDVPAAELRRKVCAAYSAAALEPEREHAFPVGRQFAEKLGYPADLLGNMPPVCTEAFTGVSNVSLFAEIAEGAVVLDLGCGAGLDSSIASRRAGRTGAVIGVDFSFPMLVRARACQRQTGANRILFCQADGERLPLPDGSIDVALVNGIFNLNPNRSAIFRELGRVIAPSGAVYAAELLLREPLPSRQQQSESNWFA